MYSFLCRRRPGKVCPLLSRPHTQQQGPVPAPSGSAYLGGDVEDSQGDDNGELLREAVAVDEEARGGEAQGPGPGGGELEAAHPLHLEHPQAAGQAAGRHHLREDVQRAQVYAERPRDMSRLCQPPFPGAPLLAQGSKPMSSVSYSAPQHRRGQGRPPHPTGRMLWRGLDGMKHPTC